MIKRFKKALCGTLIAAMTCASLAACGAQTEAPKEEAKATQDTTKPAEEKTETAPEKEESGEPTEISMLVLTVADFDPETFPGVKAVEDKLNIKLNYEFAPSSSYTEKLQITLASGDYPDLIMFEKTSDIIFMDAVQSGIIVPVTQWVEKAENLQKYTNTDSWEAMKVLDDGEIYAIPRSTMMRSDGYIVRKDWCDNLGITLPADGIVTKEELYDIMKKFTFDDPDQNGVNDTYGTVSYTDANGNIKPMFTEAFGLTGWQEMAGEDYKYMNGMYAKNNTAYRDSMEFTNKLWEDGILAPTTPTNKSSSDAIDMFRQNKAGVYKDFGANAMKYLATLKEVVPTAEISYLFLKDEQGNVQGDAFGSGYWWVNAITSAAAGKEEKIVEFLDYLLSDEGWEMCTYGPKDVTWTLNDAGERVINQDEYAKMSAARNHFTQVRRNNDPDFFFDVNMTAQEKEEPMKWVNKSIDIAKVSLDVGYVPEVGTSAAFIDYQNVLDATITKVILGEASIEDYNKALNNWYEKGGEEYVKEMNDFIAARAK